MEIIPVPARVPADAVVPAEQAEFAAQWELYECGNPHAEDIDDEPSDGFCEDSGEDSGENSDEPWVTIVGGKKVLSRAPPSNQTTMLDFSKRRGKCLQLCLG